LKRFVLAPGCALFLYKPRLVEKLRAYLEARRGPLEVFSACCHHTPPLPPGAKVVTTCPGCDRRYRQNYPEPLSVSLWELLAGDERFPFPDYRGREMTIIDACPTRGQKRIHDAVRALAGRMNIVIVEPERTREKGTCCGDTFYPALPAAQVIARMRAKGGEMPRDEVLVYCVSCSKSMFVAGKRPRYLVDLLFAEETVPGTTAPEAWHRQLDEFIAGHTGEK
jgi:RNase P subunit RPR2